MAKKGQRSVTAEGLVDEVRFLLKTLLRDDLFGDTVTLDEAEKLLETSLSVPFAEYCTFLKKQGLIQVDRESATVSVLDDGKATARGGPDPDLVAALAVHFAKHIVAGQKKPREEPTAVPSSSDPGKTQPIAVVRQPKEESSGARAMPAAPAGRPVPRPLPSVGQRYDVGEAVGEGSVGQVFVATDTVLDRPVALKQMSHVYDFVTYIPADELTGRIQRAAHDQASLQHPHILDVVDLDFGAARPQVFTRFAAGGNLKQRLERAANEPEGTLPVDVTLRILLQCCHALHHAHIKGVIHGGLKPENVLFDESGNVLLSDFGLSRVTEKGALTGPPVYVGAGATSYMAPEQLHEEKLSEAADVYALGILLYQMLTGQLPGRRSPMPSEKNKACPKGLDDVFDQMTTDAVEDRYPDFERVLDALYGGALPKKHVPDPGVLLLNTRDPYPATVPATEENTLDERPGATGSPEAVKANPELLGGEAAEWAGDGSDLPSAEAEAVDETMPAP